MVVVFKFSKIFYAELSFEASPSLKKHGADKLKDA